MFKVKTLAVAATAVMAWCTAFGATPKYVFLFIGDGMSVPQRMTAEEFSRKSGAGSLAMNALPFSAMTRTCSADSLVTDSAAAATAIACGAKTKNHYSGVDPDGKPVYSSAVAAKKAGVKVGIVTTVTITHATPAGFYAHRNNRGDAYGISIDLADSGFDFFAGGGLDVNPQNSQKHRQYAEYGDAYEYVRSKGYRIVETKNQFLALRPGDGKVFTRFTNGALDYTIDADGSQPTLAEMVAKAVEMLDGEKGLSPFFGIRSAGVRANLFSRISRWRAASLSAVRFLCLSAMSASFRQSSDSVWMSSSSSPSAELSANVGWYVLAAGCGASSISAPLRRRTSSNSSCRQSACTRLKSGVLSATVRFVAPEPVSARRGRAVPSPSIQQKYFFRETNGYLPVPPFWLLHRIHQTASMSPPL